MISKPWFSCKLSEYGVERVQEREIIHFQQAVRILALVRPARSEGCHGRLEHVSAAKVRAGRISTLEVHPEVGSVPVR